MFGFHRELQELTNLDAWNKLPSDSEKMQSLQPDNDAIHRIALSHLLIDENSNSSFQEFAAKVVEWVGSHANMLTPEDVESLEKLKQIFLRRLPKNDTCIAALQELAQAAKISKDHAMNISAGFDAVTRYLPNRDEWLRQAASRAKEGAALCRKLEGAEWAAILEEYKSGPDNLASDGLNAFHEGKITMEQFCSLIFCWSLMKQFPGTRIGIQPLFDPDGTVNSVSAASIRQTLESSGKYRGQRALLNEEKMNAFFRSMHAQPASEQFYFYIDAGQIDLPQNEVKKGAKIFNNTLTITEDIYASQGVNVFNQFRGGLALDIKYRMLPSLSMMQQFLVAYAGNADAVKLTPVIGLSSAADIVENIESDTRDMALPFPGVDLPKEADMLLAPNDIDFIGHDFYHSIVASDVPHELRRAFGKYAKAIFELKEQFHDPLVYAFLDQLYERIIDMEHPFFRQNLPASSLPIRHPTDAQKFLYSLDLQRKNVLNRLFIDRSRKQGTGADTFSTSMMIDMMILSYTLQKRGVMDKLAQKLHRENFCLKTGITRQDLEAIVKLGEVEKADMLKHIQELHSQPEAMLEPEMNQQIEVDGEKMTFLQFSKLMFPTIDRMDIAVHLYACMEGAH